MQPARMVTVFEIFDAYSFVLQELPTAFTPIAMPAIRPYTVKSFFRDIPKIHMVEVPYLHPSLQDFTDMDTIDYLPTQPQVAPSYDALCS